MLHVKEHEDPKAFAISTQRKTHQNTSAWNSTPAHSASPCRQQILIRIRPTWFWDLTSLSIFGFIPPSQILVTTGIITCLGDSELNLHLPETIWQEGQANVYSLCNCSSGRLTIWLTTESAMRNFGCLWSTLCWKQVQKQIKSAKTPSLL